MTRTCLPSLPFLTEFNLTELPETAVSTFLISVVVPSTYKKAYVPVSAVIVMLANS